MTEKQRTARRRRGGFTTLEMLMAMLIMLLAGGVVLGGLPAAIEAYNKVIDFANAQVLLSSTMTRLRDEIGTAREVTIDGQDDGAGMVYTINYTNAQGNRLKIYFRSDNADAKGLYLEYLPLTPPTPGTDPPPPVLSPMASNGVTPRNLYTIFDSVVYVGDKDDPLYTGDILTIYNLRVENGTETLASADEFQIRVLSCVP